MIHIVLYQPEIPQNTGNIARLCACNDFTLHLIHPLGFSLAKKQLLRAGMDYWDGVKREEHASWEDFSKQVMPGKREQVFFFSSKSQKPYWELQFPAECFLVFGAETGGLPGTLHREYADRFATIPMMGTAARCLNLSSSAAIVAYEALRQHCR